MTEIGALLPPCPTLVAYPALYDAAVDGAVNWFEGPLCDDRLMRNHHSAFSVARTGNRSGRRSPSKQANGSDFVWLLAAGCAIVAVVSWNVAPQVQSIWTSTTASPEEIARIEASVYYSGCDEARASGVAPLYAGQAGYREGMDGDGDGVACEPYRGY